MKRAPNVYIGDTKKVNWKTDSTPDDDRERGMSKDVVQIIGFDPTKEKDMEKSEIALVVTPGELSKAKGGSHTVKGPTAYGGKIDTNNPPASHRERMKFAKMAAERMLGSSKPEDEGAHQPSRVSGRDAPKDPYSNFSTQASGMESDAVEMFGKQTFIVKPSEIGSSTPEKGASAHQPKTIKKPRK